ncbi:MAG: sigma factor-like helix-turn-helix DNA-binding protein [Verrucomicrobiota bacterium]
MDLKPSIDLGLAVSALTLKRGETRTQEELAAFCGCSKAMIYLIEKRALKKLRHPSRLRALAEASDRKHCSLSSPH